MAELSLFIDTNILLNFYSFPDDDLGILDELIGMIGPSDITLHLPKQVENELKRNRESKLQAAMSEFKNAKLQTAVPNHMRGTETAKQYVEAVKAAEQARKLLIGQATSLALQQGLEVDQKISALFEAAHRYPEDDHLYQKALIRMNKGNPPGKAQSIGDRYVWEVLLHHVPNGDLHIVSKDGDYASPFSMDKQSRPLGFLADEWSEAKDGGSLAVHTNIKAVVEYFKQLQAQPVVNAPADEPIRDIDPPDLRVDRPAAPRAGGEVANLNEVIQPAAPIVARELVETAVRDLAESGSFSITHVAIRDLKPLLSNLTKDDVETLFRAAIDNNQIRWILSDEDVADLYLSLINAWVTNVNVDLAEELIEQMGLSPEEPGNPE
ncbi:hypothetical protein ALP03_00073 [Pseudomonas amygdali pv. tabaci]|uniref:DUF4935 domain-containing protein n=1 Tax=Pseudomonas amygdali pv. tabaci TaxID=322 RepID=A0A3M6HY75_PSEAJ|nr:hypothetical protein ALP03_00073 [Pseudomonas amygdali pv. tabaci]